MAEHDQAEARRHGRLWRRVLAGLAVCLALLVIFHRPILLAIGRHIALRYADRENLKIDFRLEGNPFSHLTARNVHAFATGPSPIESIDIDQLYVDYDLIGFARHGLTNLFRNFEAHSARVQTRIKPRRPQHQLPALPANLPKALVTRWLVRSPQRQRQL